MRNGHSIEVKPNFGHGEVHVALSVDAARTVANVVSAEFPVLAAQLIAAASRIEDHTTVTANRRVNRDQINQTNQVKERGIYD